MAALTAPRGALLAAGAAVLMAGAYYVAFSAGAGERRHAATRDGGSLVDLLVQHRGPEASERVWALVDEGGADALEELEGLHDHDYEGLPLDNEQEGVLIEAVLGLGALAQDSDLAYARVQAMSDPEFWAAHCTWTSGRRDYAPDFFTSFGIQSLGVAGRPDLDEQLGRLRARDANFLHRFAGDVVQSSFYGDMRRELGGEFLSWLRGSSHEQDEDFEAWTATESGRNWFEWANACMRGPRPPASSEEGGG
ncbi:hypothetical protein [Engelhardtia mirabilis]|uniref:DUF4375 domain-containing protein n=1 Tax=Engelhardtia mirabilis TaxID=2528011 RepID=A0A518BH29_9BACT|nr:hypothetical protein Pla133_12890 [Planctomycetes bacterium Pla133]QDV00550.1 hypothetical protein Pla86_12890 [Planctomycetes bacterium Pla86]